MWCNQCGSWWCRPVSFADLSHWFIRNFNIIGDVQFERHLPAVEGLTKYAIEFKCRINHFSKTFLPNAFWLHHASSLSREHLKGTEPVWLISHQVCLKERPYRAYVWINMVPFYLKQQCICDSEDWIMCSIFHFGCAESLLQNSPADTNTHACVAKNVSF